MADAGLTDIFVPYNILGDTKLARLAVLNDRITMSVTADSPDTVAGYARTFLGAPSRSRCSSSAIQAADVAAYSRQRRRSLSHARSRRRPVSGSAA